MPTTTTTSTTDTRRPTRTLAVLIAVVMAITVLLYLRTAWYGFTNFDDYQYVVKNPHIPDGLSIKSIKWALTTGYFSYWHPITWLGYLTLTTFFGVTPGPMHVANFVIHSANAGLLLYVMWRMTGSVWRSAIVAAAFAWHPLRVESVAWISELKDVISGFLWLLTMLLYVRYAERPTAARYAAVCVGFFVGLASKPMIVTLPGALLLLDFWPLGRTRWLPRDDIPRASLGRIALEKVPLFAVSLIVSYFAIKVQSVNYALGADVPTQLRLQNAVVSFTRYLSKLFWPRDLAVLYPHPSLVVDGKVGAGITVVAIIVFIAITIVALLWWRRRPYVLVGWLWFLGTVLPVSGVLVQSGPQSMADRYTYIPLMMMTAAAVWFVADLVAARPRLQAIAAAAAGVALVALLIKSTIQIGHWRNDLTLYSHAAAVTEKNYLAHAGVGYYYYENGQPEAALPHYVRALRARPIDAVANGNMGKYYQKKRDYERAEWYYRRAMQHSPPDADLHNNMANLMAEQGRIAAAIEHHEAAVRIAPDLAVIRYNYGVTLAGVGKLRDAQAQLERALQLDPDYADARFTYALVQAGLGYEAAAVGQLRDAIFLRRDWFDALRSLAWLLATSPDPRVRDGAQAVTVAERANQLTGYENPIALDTLGAAYAEAGRFDNAVATAERAEQIARAAGKADLADRFAQRLALYRAKKPFHRVAGATTQPFNP